MSRTLKFSLHRWENGAMVSYLKGTELPEEVEAGEHMFMSDEEQANAADNSAAAFAEVDVEDVDTEEVDESEKPTRRGRRAKTNSEE